MSSKSIYIIITTLILLSTVVSAQTSINLGSQTSVQGCNYFVYDNGGSSNHYGPNLNQTLTIYPAANQGGISLNIISIDIHHSDTLFIYDGPTATGTPMVWLNNSNQGNLLQTYSSSQDNATGAMTIRFRTSSFTTFLGLNHGAGFKIHATCVPQCQPFQIVLDTASCSHLPVLHPDDQYYYLDLCPGEQAHIGVKGVYPNNQANGYTQQDATTLFTWVIGTDTTLSAPGLTSLDYPFEDAHGYDISIVATDAIACPAAQPIAFRLRTSKNPLQTIHNLPQLCVGQSVTPSIGYPNSNQFQLQEVHFTQQTSLVIHDTVFLPDGISCPPYGTYYRSNVTFTDFANGASISNANDLLYVRIKMEHSAIEDLYVKIYCPNGQNATILPHPNYSSDWSIGMYRINLGIAYRPDEGTCDPNINPMGEPWNYVWSNNNNLGYIYAPANGVLYNDANIHSQYNPHWDNGVYHPSVDSSNVANMTHIYHPYQNFSSLIGCPLNGNWFIQVQDLESEDNGYIVEWELALNPELLPQNWNYTVGIDTLYFTGNGTNGNTIYTSAPGHQVYTLHIVDDFGCVYDTSFTLQVHAIPEVDLGENRYICEGQTLSLSPNSPNNQYNYVWGNGTSGTNLTVTGPGDYVLTARIMQNGQVLCAGSDTLSVILADPSETLLTDEICAGEPYHGHGFDISAATLAGFEEFTTSRTLTNALGCDSIIHLNLDILPTYHEHFQKFACQHYEWQGETYTQSGDYERHYTTAKGCDSILTLHLSIGFPEEKEVWETVCGHYLWHGEIFDESGDYYHIFTSTHECDSAVSLHLTVIDTSLLVTSTNPDFCTNHETTLIAEGLNFDNYLWNTGETATSIEVSTSGYYTLTASNIACESIRRILVPYCPLMLNLPNAITPSNGDGLNDWLSLTDFFRSQIVDFSIGIYSRWGETVFLSHDKYFEWDGSNNGKIMTNTVYNYVIRCTDHNGRPYLFKGSITVL
ncbi:MAG: gliding motility-associated C-terminal domain-containing protein [Bacteroidales bacterium]|nr:gliding motility-associated C-terminal domain-containing protein [Bacteroidales bacterium]